ncbi:hypothetical protein JX265_005652 [Neoarthrinium moseri]|uniref:Uncharacterized protein n=1 Tax=Neoarthrinium moseri TaxID=1658444 RepID=A0A9Q0AQY9_9PEZI|nr:hypothetical protein JX265_005652 [Neoarthrinium moseri]
MASRSSRYDPKYDDPYVSHRAYPDSHAGVGDDAFERRAEVVTASQVEQSVDPAAKLQRCLPSTQVEARRLSTPPFLEAPFQLAPAAPALQTRRFTTEKDRFGRWVNRPALKKNMKTYSRKGLNTLGDVVQAYAAAQNPQLARGRSAGPGYGGRYDDYHDDPYDRPRRRRHYSISPSPSPPPRRRASAKDSDRRRPPLHGRQKSYSVSPARTRGYDSDEDRRHRRRSRHYSVSPSPSPQRRRHRSHSHRRGSETPTRGSQSRREFYKNEMKSPNPEVAHRWQLAARAALEAGGVTAFRLRKEPGSWTGQKGAKVATAALGAAAIDAFIDKDPRRTKAGGVKGMAESVVGGLVASKLMGFQSATTRKGKPRVF